ncbi:hypothetical protein WICMUC_002997 [Wickerhamomyces mucosus]|uniref:Uncharacterized protein n=1 Tax=Wickerhamomyces mucosus TaxID=1378264 RepID=A0A9P8TDJ8_9ASCO|nr:hypothetical protein WICMUC_002997 [Wickerhamomyces mucosus]
MTSSSDWIIDVEDINSINKQIQEVENNIKQLRQLNQNSPKLDEQVHDLSSALQLAIANDDTNTIDALILSYGKLPNLIDAKKLITERKKLKLQEIEENKSNQIHHELGQITKFDLDELKLIKKKIENLQVDQFKLHQRKNFDSKILSFKDQFVDRFKVSMKSTSRINSPTLPDSNIDSFKDLINLQSLLFHLHPYPSSLWAFDVIAQNFKISFDYHFNTEKDTNRIDKPELFFTYHLNYLDNHLSKLNRVFNLQTTELAENFAHNEFISSSIIPIRYKLNSFLQILRKNLDDDPNNEQDTNLLIHLIHETIKYDQDLISKHYYDPLSNAQWNGLIEVFQYRDFENLLDLEIKVNLRNYNQIISSSSNFQIDLTSSTINELKPTISALKLKYLFENLNKSFEKFFLNNYTTSKILQKFKLKLFSQLYLKLLQLYHDRLDDGFSALNELFKKSKNLLKSEANDIDISGVNGLERLFRIYCSTKFIVNSLNYWNQEFIFIELNELFNQLSTSKSISLFDTILIDYNALLEKTTSLIVVFMKKIMLSLLRKYNNLNNWSTLAIENNEIKFSSELVPLISNFDEYLKFIGNLISIYDFISIKNQISYILIEYFHHNIIKSNNFTYDGINQLKFDVNRVFDSLNLSRNFPLYNKIQEIFQVLKITNEQITQIIKCNSYSISQYAKLGEYHDLKKELKLKHLTDNDILDALLRIKN